MSIASVVRRGFGNIVNYLPTMGFGSFGTNIGPCLVVANQTTSCQAIANQTTQSNIQALQETMPNVSASQMTQSISASQTTWAGYAAIQIEAD